LRALSGTFAITVSHPGIATSAAAAFTVSPVLFTLAPPSAPAGGPSIPLTVTGVGFTRNSVITINGATLATNYLLPTALSTTIPASALRIAGLATIQVADSAGAGRSQPSLFTIASVPVPSISAINPSSAIARSGGLTLTITGANCPVGCNIQWSGSTLETSHPNDTTMVATLPASFLANPVAAAIQLVNPYGSASNAATFTVYPNAAVLTSLNPPSVTTGSPTFSLTIHGSGFVSGALAMWNETALPTTYMSATQVIGFVSSELLTLRAGVAAAITVVNPGGAVSNTLTFALDPPQPAILSLTPASAPAGSDTLEILVAGANFAVNCVARWNGTPATTTFIDSAHLKVSASAKLLSTAGGIPVTVTNPSGLVTTAATFTLIAATPLIVGLSPVSASADSAAFTLTVNGSLFTPASIVYWNSAALATTYVSASRLTAAVPAHLTVGNARVTVATAGLISQPAAFQVTAALPPPAAPAPAITAGGVVNAFSGRPALAPGTLISIYGVNLATAITQAEVTPLPVTLGATSVTIGGILAPLLFVSPTQINAQVPYELPAGIAAVVVRTAGSQTSPAVVEITATAAALLTSDHTHALAVNYPDGTLNSAANPAHPGDYLVFYATGQGLLNRPVSNGAPPPEGDPSLPLAGVEVRLGGVPAQVAFAGLAPGFVGLLQINMVVPKSAPGDQTLELTLGNVPGSTARLWVDAIF
jgi:uncharacterized protein (TIGR03437 family)